MYEEQIQTITAQVAETLAEQGLPFAPDCRAAQELLSAPGWAEELAQLTGALLACGADIVEMNTVRKRLSAVKGGFQTGRSRRQRPAGPRCPGA